MLHIKILSIQYPERYVLRRMVILAHNSLRAEFPAMEVEITEVGDPATICQYATVIVLPTLVINEKVVSSGRAVTREEVTAWLREAMK